MQHLIQHRAARAVDESAEVPVHVVGEHDWGGLVEGDGDQARGPARARGGGGHGVGCVGDYGAWEAFVAGVEEGECDAAGVVGDEGPVALVVADGAAVEGVAAVVLVGGDVGCPAIDGEGAVFDAVGVAADDGAVVGVDGVGVVDVLSGIVVAEDDVLGVAVFVVDE